MTIATTAVKSPPVEEFNIQGEITKAASKITSDESKQFQDLMDMGMHEGHQMAICEITPAMAAKILDQQNKYNRDIRVPKAKEYARQMQAKQWHLHGQGLQFYKSGELADGQHRLLGVVIANVPVQFSVFTGLDKTAIDVIDTGTKRTAADAASLEGIENAKVKESVWKSANSYLKRLGRGSGAISTHEVKEEIQKEDSKLSSAISVANDATKAFANPTIKESLAASVAFVLLKSNWDATQILSLLKELQSGDGRESESAPLFLAAEAASKADAKIGDKWLCVMRGLILTAQGIKAARKSEFTAIRRKPIPDPLLTQ